MNRFKNQILLAAGFAVLAGVISGITAAPAIAQAIKAVLIKNVDERGRTPYFEPVTCTAIPMTTICTATAPAIPANRRLVIEHLSGVVTSTTGGPVSVLLSAQTGPVRSRFAFEVLNQTHTFNEPALAYFSGGEIPSLQIKASTLTPTLTFTGEITGYLVDLTI